MCRVLKVSKSGYYAWKIRPQSARRVENQRLLIEIRKIFYTNNREYGSPRVWRELKAVNVSCCENRVARLMRLNGLVAVQRAKFCVTTDSKHDFALWPNILNRDFTVS
jgi:putative transposase